MSKIETIPEYIEAIRNCPLEKDEEEYLLRKEFGVQFHDRSIIIKGDLEKIRNFYETRKNTLKEKYYREGKSRDHYLVYGNREDFITIRVESPPNFALPEQLFPDLKNKLDFSVQFIAKYKSLDGKEDLRKSTDEARNETIKLLEFAMQEDMNIFLPIRSGNFGDLYYPSLEKVLSIE